MPMRVQWEAGFELGHPVLDAQHQALLGLCNQLADHAGDDEAGVRDFDQAYARLRALARAHFDAEAAHLAASAEADADVDDHRVECDEFEYLADEIATTGNFDRLELQRFLTLWWLGHVTGSVRRQREKRADGSASG